MLAPEWFVTSAIITTTQPRMTEEDVAAIQSPASRHLGPSPIDPRVLRQGAFSGHARLVPQLAQRIMRHADYRTTQEHYTVLGLTDTAKAIESLPAIPTTTSTAAAAAGTCDVGPRETVAEASQQIYQQSVRNSQLLGARTCGETGRATVDSNTPLQNVSAATCETKRDGVVSCDVDAGVAQLVEHQPSKLNVDGSSPFARFLAPTRTSSHGAIYLRMG